MPDPAEIMDILQQVKGLSKRYHALTGKPLGATGEIAEFEAARLLGLELAPARTAGHDALETLPDGTISRVQIKGRCYPRKQTNGQRIGRIDINKRDWDKVVLVLIDSADHETYEIWEAGRDAVVAAIQRPGSRGRNERYALAVTTFQNLGRLRWSPAPRPPGTLETSDQPRPGADSAQPVVQEAPSLGIVRTQRDKMRELFRQHGSREEAIIRDYAAAEGTGEVLRKSDSHQTSPADYAARLLADGKKKGWLGHGPMGTKRSL